MRRFTFTESPKTGGLRLNHTRGIAPLIWPSLVDYPRSLKNATAQAFDIKVSKETRNTMSGKRWETMTEDFRKEVEEYALKDSVLCLRLWQDTNLSGLSLSAILAG